MKRQPSRPPSITDPAARSARAAALDTDEPVAGIPGPGRWLIAELAPVSLFSLKTSQATSSVGRSLVVPTPYAIKMACVDAAFRAGWSEQACADFLHALVGVEVRVRPPEVAVVTHTLVKIRQEPKERSPARPYTSSVGYREVVFHHGRWEWAFDLAGGDSRLAEGLVQALPHIRYVGKRGSFVQFLELRRQRTLGPEYTAAVGQDGSFQVPAAWHIQQLDDFGPEATFARLSTYSPERAERGRDRVFLTTIVPLGLVSSGPGFSEYRASP